VIHRFDLHFGDGLHLRASGIDDLHRPSKRRGRRSHLVDDLFAVFLAGVGRLRCASSTSL
jgi:hypothetical protein